MSFDLTNQVGSVCVRGSLTRRPLTSDRRQIQTVVSRVQTCKSRPSAKSFKLAVQPGSLQLFSDFALVVLWSAGRNQPARCECPPLSAVFCNVLSRPQAFSRLHDFTCGRGLPPALLPSDAAVQGEEAVSSENRIWVILGPETSGPREAAFMSTDSTEASWDRSWIITLTT